MRTLKLHNPIRRLHSWGTGKNVIYYDKTFSFRLDYRNNQSIQKDFWKSRTLSFIADTDD